MKPDEILQTLVFSALPVDAVRVWAFILLHPGFPCGVTAKVTGINIRAVRRAINQLDRAGLLVPTTFAAEQSAASKRNARLLYGRTVSDKVLVLAARQSEGAGLVAGGVN